jgi:hypothetical protein
VRLTEDELRLVDEVAARRRKTDTRSLVALKERGWDPDYVGILGEMAFCKGLTGTLEAWQAKVEREGWFLLGDTDDGTDVDRVNVKTTLLRPGHFCRSLRLLVSIDPRHTESKYLSPDVVYVAAFWRPGSRRVFFAGYMPGWRILERYPTPGYPGSPVNTFLSFMVPVPELWRMDTLRACLASPTLLRRSDQ